ncbi:MAG: sigma-54 dependent transcriptional regulator [Caulobacterales bacterium]|nr:sigma-54 dependent transcriptional regulator [Caulobacterales bacterium]
MAHDILVVDDERDICELIAGILEDEGHEVRLASDSDAALAAVRERKPSLVILDVWLRGSAVDGMELLDILKELDRELPIVLISGHGNVETAVAAIRRGAYDFIEKPFESDRLIHTVARAIEASELRRENAELRAGAHRTLELIGESHAMQQVRLAVSKVAPTNSRVLISGPPGAGKEIVARLIHAESPRAGGRFVAVNAAAIAPERMESELFGEEEVDGRVRLVGLFELAHNGTLFLDEVADMPRETQSKILRALVDQRFRRLGGAADVQVDVRVLSSSSKDLSGEIAASRFREDLFHRLNVVPLRVPPLSDRREDIPALIDYFIARVSETSGLSARPMGPDVMAALQAHDWPGNVRQLRNNVERLLILASGGPEDPITLERLPSEVIGATETTSGYGSERLISLKLRDAREHFEREYLTAQINRFGGNISRTAEFIGMERSALHRKLKSLGVTSGGRSNAEA